MPSATHSGGEGGAGDPCIGIVSLVLYRAWRSWSAGRRERGADAALLLELVQGTVESVVDGSSGCLRVGHTRLIQSCVSSRDVAKNETKSYKQIKRDAGDRAAMCCAVHVKTGASVAAAGRAATRGRAARQSQWRAVGSGRVPCGVAYRTRGTKISHHHSRTSSISSIAASKQPP